MPAGIFLWHLCAASVAMSLLTMHDTRSSVAFMTKLPAQTSHNFCQGHPQVDPVHLSQLLADFAAASDPRVDGRRLLKAKCHMQRLT